MGHVYFPGLIGMNIPSGDEQTSMKKGFSYNTAIEFRPQYVNAMFFRFNYDALSNHYSAQPQRIPTNIVAGKLPASFFLLGAGYRRKIHRIGVYALLQPGLNTSSYDVATDLKTGYGITSKTEHNIAFKITSGMEYYIVDHFALIFEPAYYHLYSGRQGLVLNPNYIGFNFGFTTTLF